PSGVAFSSDYVNKIVRYFNDVSADSLSRTNVYATVKEYADTTGTAKYKVTQPKLCKTGIGCFKAWAFTDTYADDCPTGGAFTHCVSDTAMRAEVEGIRSFFGLAPGSN